MPAPQVVNPSTREVTAEAAARGEAATGDEVPLLAGAGAATGEADVAGPGAARGPFRRPAQRRSLSMGVNCFCFFRFFCLSFIWFGRFSV